MPRPAILAPTQGIKWEYTEPGSLANGGIYSCSATAYAIECHIEKDITMLHCMNATYNIKTKKQHCNNKCCMYYNYA